MIDYRELHELKVKLVGILLKIEKFELPNHGRTTMLISDIQTNPGHTNDKGIYIKGTVIIAVIVKYAGFEWKRAYQIMQEELDQFTLDEFKKRIYQESRIWIKEKELEADVLDKLKASKNEAVYLD